MKGNSTHFVSKGNYYSHGNKGNFGIVDGSSVGQYVNKKITNKTASERATFYARLMEQLKANEIMGGLDVLVQVFPKLKTLIAPIIVTGYNLQDEKENINLQPVPTTLRGLYQTSISMNAQTTQMHK